MRCFCPSSSICLLALDTRFVRKVDDMRRRSFLLGLGLLMAGSVAGGLWARFGLPLLNGWGQWLPDFGPAEQADRSGRSRSAIPLPEEMAQGALSLEEAIDHRRSVRKYSDQPLQLEELSRLLHAADGITEPRYGFRAAPSAGALYPLELYVVTNRVRQLDQGIYHYLADSHSLELIRGGDFGGAAASAALGQEVIANAAAVLVVSAVMERTRKKYGSRAERYVLLEAGHVGQNVYLAATALGLGICAVGAFYDDELNRLLTLDAPREAALYLLAVGRL